MWVSVAESLAQLAHAALAPGLLRGYRRVDEALTTVRGRIRLGDQIRRRPGMTIPLEVSYSEFTPDIAENRILRTAAHRLQFLPDLPDGTRRRLAMVDARLADATLIPQGAPIPTWTPSRLNARFQDVLALADRIVRRISVEVEDGHASSAAFVTEMPALFERFIESELTAALHGHGGRLLQNPVVDLSSGTETDIGHSDATDGTDTGTASPAGTSPLPAATAPPPPRARTSRCARGWSTRSTATRSPPSSPPTPPTVGRAPRSTTGCWRPARRSAWTARIWSIRRSAATTPRSPAGSFTPTSRSSNIPLTCPKDPRPAVGLSSNLRSRPGPWRRPPPPGIAPRGDDTPDERDRRSGPTTRRESGAGGRGNGRRLSRRVRGPGAAGQDRAEGDPQTHRPRLRR
ncbi:hypothetical protein ACFSSF_05120 [Dietzia aerolata]|uniref:5-methylcytosine restriction system specificity protein McrC n=1 Tax=Dietzia aerolata TaxID=595984 RepID=UPI003641725A